ncbi:MAG: right-handed parallel beta-helix repeat-containing protein [Candidatus Taylorbacteria bacterium]
MSDILRNTLKDIVKQYGSNIFNEPLRLYGLLNDYCKGQYKRERNIVECAVEENIHSALLGNRALPISLLKSKLAKRLHDDRALSIDASQWAVDCFAFALEISSPQEECSYEVSVCSSVDPKEQSACVVIHVPEGIATIEEAIIIAEDGEQIIVNSAIIHDGLLRVNKRIKISSIADNGKRASLRNTTGPALVLSNGAVIRGFQIESEADTAVKCDGTGIELHDCIISTIGGNGLYLLDCSSVLATGLEIRNCRGAGIEMAHGSELRLTSSHLYSNRRSNLIAGSGTYLIADHCSFQRSSQGSGIITDGRVEIIECILFDNARSGVWVETQGDICISHGQIEGNHDWGVCVSGNGQATICGVKMPDNRRGMWKAENPNRCRVKDIVP